MHKLGLLASTSLVALFLTDASIAQTWTMPASPTTTAQAGKSEQELLQEAVRQLENAQKLSARPEIEAAIKALSAIVEKSTPARLPRRARRIPYRA